MGDGKRAREVEDDGQGVGASKKKTTAPKRAKMDF
jgi:hypothetical protein